MLIFFPKRCNGNHMTSFTLTQKQSEYILKESTRESSHQTIGEQRITISADSGEA